MNNIFGFIASCFFVHAGWFMHRNPAKTLDFVFGKDDQPRPVQLFSIFGIGMMAFGSLSAAINLLMAVARLFP